MLRISQEKYLRSLIKEFNLEEANGKDTPAPTVTASFDGTSDSSSSSSSEELAELSNGTSDLIGSLSSAEGVLGSSGRSASVTEFDPADLGSPLVG